MIVSDLYVRDMMAILQNIVMPRMLWDCKIWDIKKDMTRIQEKAIKFLATVKTCELHMFVQSSKRGNLFSELSK